MPGERNVICEEYLPGKFRFREAETGRWASYAEYTQSVTTSIYGIRGYKGEFQKYAAFEQIFGSGMPTPGHRFWKTITEIAPPTENLVPEPGRQYRVMATFLDKEGNVITQDFNTRIAEGFDVGEVNESMLSFSRTHEEYTAWPLVEEEDWYTPIGRTVSQVEYHMIGVPEE